MLMTIDHACSLFSHRLLILPEILQRISRFNLEIAPHPLTECGENRLSLFAIKSGFYSAKQLAIERILVAVLAGSES